MLGHRGLAMDLWPWVITSHGFPCECNYLSTRQVQLELAPSVYQVIYYIFFNHVGDLSVCMGVRVLPCASHHWYTFGRFRVLLLHTALIFVNLIWVLVASLWKASHSFRQRQIMLSHIVRHFGVGMNVLKEFNVFSGMGLLTHSGHVRAVMHTGIANSRSPLKSEAKKIPGACANRNFTYLVRGPSQLAYMQLDRVFNQHDIKAPYICESRVTS